MTWVVFADRPSFDAYNLAACLAQPIPIPHPGKKQSDHTVQINNQWTQAWVDTFGVFVAAPDSFILCNVPASDVATFSLTLSQNPPSNPIVGPRTIIWNGVSRTIFNAAPVNLQPKPPTWTDPETGIIYVVP